jgi:hypothetical protein
MSRERWPTTRLTSSIQARTVAATAGAMKLAGHGFEPSGEWATRRYASRSCRPSWRKPEHAIRDLLQTDVCGQPPILRNAACDRQATFTNAVRLRACSAVHQTGRYGHAGHRYGHAGCRNGHAGVSIWTRSRARRIDGDRPVGTLPRARLVEAVECCIRVIHSMAVDQVKNGVTHASCHPDRSF